MNGMFDFSRHHDNDNDRPFFLDENSGEPINGHGR